MKLLLHLISGCVILLSLIFHADGRVFTDDTGRTVDAELVGVRGENVVLARGGRAAQWPIAKLSANDQAYVREWQKNPPPVARISARIFERDGQSSAGAQQSPGVGGPPKNIPLLKQTEETAKQKYDDVDLTNDSTQDATHLTMAYVMYVITPSGTVSSQPGKAAVDAIPAGKRVTVPTESATFVRSKTTSTTIGVDRLGGVSTGSKTSRSKERFGGVWVRVYETNGSLVGEAKDLHPEVERTKPAWTGSTGGGGSSGPGGGPPMDLPIPVSFEELEKILGLIEELKEKLPPPPGPSGSLPKPPGFPGR